MHDVISAFLDNEPFDAHELSAALATPGGRELLVDLAALRSVVQQVLAVPAARPAMAGRTNRFLAAAAAVVMLGGGYALGQWSARPDSQDVATSLATVAAPEPTSEFRFEAGVNWSETPADGGD